MTARKDLTHDARAQRRVEYCERIGKCDLGMLLQERNRLAHNGTLVATFSVKVDGQDYGTFSLENCDDLAARARARAMQLLTDGDWPTDGDVSVRYVSTDVITAKWAAGVVNDLLGFLAEDFCEADDMVP